MFRKFIKQYKLIIFLSLLIIIGIILSSTKFFKPVKNTIYIVDKPLAIVTNYTVNQITLFFNNLFHLASLGEENQSLIKENLNLQSQLSILKEVQHENEILKREIGLLEKNNKNIQVLPANIVGRSSLGYIKTIVIDRGLNDNLKVGQAVISEGYLVGTVKQVYDNSSEVDLITDYNSVVPVLLQDSRGTGLLRGGLRGLTMDEIPLNISIKTGEQVITSGLGGDMPAGILVGKVDEVISHEGEIFQKVTVSSPIQIYFLEFVFVVK